jgi:hypothetical protein
MTFADLIAALQPILWPVGEAQNLVGPHRQMVIEALIDLQQWVECLQVNNTQVVPQCNTLFKCGYTVTDAPRGRIKRLYVIDQINQTTGKEDPTAPVDWCSAVDYRPVDYADLNRYVSQTLAGKLDNGFWGWCGINLAGIVAFPACWFTKYTYPPPTDAGLAQAPPLPQGYHYPQTSTDEPNGVRAQYGMWAVRGGQIFVAPWIQSTETIIIEWDGIKRTWNDLDQVDDDPNLQKAVEQYVRWQHALKYDHDYEAAQAAVQSYNDFRANLMYECRQETMVLDPAEAETSAARGASLVVTTFVNQAQTQTAQCPAGTTGNAVTVTVPAGTVASAVSVDDANAKAKSLALQQAGAQLVCTTPPVTYQSTQQTYTAHCVGSTGNPVTIVVAAGAFTSILSQADADAQALASATNQAQAQLACTWTNTQQSFTATCPAGGTGSPVTKTVAAGTFTSMLSQSDADAQALASATSLANAALSCTPSAPVFQNTDQPIRRNGTCFYNITPHQFPCTSHNIQVQVDVPAGMFSSTVSQLDANNQAINYGNQLAAVQLTAACNQLVASNGCNKQPPIGGI